MSQVQQFTAIIERKGDGYVSLCLHVNTPLLVLITLSPTQGYVAMLHQYLLWATSQSHDQPQKA